jgi:hypothetical protein
VSVEGPLEDVPRAVFKLLCFRDKDLADLRRLVAVQGRALDDAWVRRHILAMRGEGDERMSAWDAIIHQHGRGPDPSGVVPGA